MDHVLLFCSFFNFSWQAFQAMAANMINIKYYISVNFFTSSVLDERVSVKKLVNV